MRIYNTMTKSKEEFIPLEEGKVKMYACGITVYDECHVGHAKQAIVYDMISQYLRYRGYDVTYVRNYTDVDDKIINRANELGINAIEYSADRIREVERILKWPVLINWNGVSGKNIVAFCQLSIFQYYIIL